MQLGIPTAEPSAHRCTPKRLWQGFCGKQVREVMLSSQSGGWCLQSLVRAAKLHWQLCIQTLNGISPVSLQQPMTSITFSTTKGFVSQYASCDINNAEMSKSTRA